MNRKISPVIKDAVDYKLELKPCEKFVLDNGIPVYAVNAGAQDVLQIEMVFYAGNFFEQKKGIAAATNFLIKNGTSTRTALQLNEAFEYYGAYCNRACYNETAVLTLHTLTRHLEKLLPVMEDMLTDSIFPSQELEIYQQNSRQRLQVNLQKCEFIAGRLIDSYLYGEKHPYGTYNNIVDIDSLDVDSIKNFYKDHYLQGQCVIFVAGNIPAGLEKLLNDHFGKLKLGKPPVTLPEKITEPFSEKKYRIQNDAASVQGAIRIAAAFPNRHHPDFKKAIILNNVFGGFFGSRLMSNIREDKGYT